MVILTIYLRRAGHTPLATWAPLLPLVAGAWGVITGIEGIVVGWKQSAADRGAQPIRILAATVVLSAVALGAIIWRQRAPYWDAVWDVAAGTAAEAQLKKIVEQQISAIEAGATGAAALESWRTAATQGAILRPAFESALTTARQLASLSDGPDRATAETNARFYPLCIEWMTLYDRILSEIADVSMAEPPPDWPEAQNEIMDRIQALSSGAGAGS